MDTNDLDKTFQRMTKKIRKMDRPLNTEALELYGLYKQATIGDCNTNKPFAVDLMANAKWNAWQAKKGMSREEAKEEYVTKSSLLGLAVDETEE